MPKPMSILLFVVMVLMSSTSNAYDTTMWRAPEANTFGFSVFSGFSVSENGLRGAVLGGQADFFFRYFLAAVNGDIIFSPDGAAFSLMVDLNARFGPFYSGLLVGLHWLPGKLGAPSSGLGCQVGVHVPLGIDGLWINLAYRPTLVFLQQTNLTYHSLNVGLIIEAGL